MPHSAGILKLWFSPVRLGVLAMAFGAMPSFATAETDELVGRWEGTVMHKDRSWRIAFDVWDEPGRLAGSLDFPDAGRFALPLSELLYGKGGTLKLVQDRARATVTIEAKRSNGRIDGTLEGFGVQARVFLTRESPRPQQLIETPVRFKNRGVVLAGTLVKPPTPGPHPVIIWTHGSGFMGRKSEPYRMLGYMFARHGVASLLYDKRGVGDSTGNFRHATLEELAEDALAAVPMLKKRDHIDPARIGIGGHSQGGWIAPLVATRSDQIRFVVVMAAAGMSPFEQGSFVVENRLRENGYEDAVIDQVVHLRRRLFRYLRTGENIEAIEKQLTEARREPWYRDALLPLGSLDDFRAHTPAWLSLEPGPLWERIHDPVLAVWGEQDRVVPSRRSYELIADALRRGGNDQATLLILPDADHNLSLVSRDENSWDWPRIAPDLEMHIADWAAGIKHARSEPVHRDSGAEESSEEGADGL